MNMSLFIAVQKPLSDGDQLTYEMFDKYLTASIVQVSTEYQNNKEQRNESDQISMVPCTANLFGRSQHTRESYENWQSKLTFCLSDLDDRFKDMTLWGHYGMTEFISFLKIRIDSKSYKADQLPQMTEDQFLQQQAKFISDMQI